MDTVILLRYIRNRVMFFDETLIELFDTDIRIRGWILLDSLKCL